MMNRRGLVCVLFVLGLSLSAKAQINQTTSASRLDSAYFSQTRILPNLDDLPFRGQPEEYYNLFPGVVVQDFRGTDFVHLRGSRHDEIGYTFEGVDVRSVFSGRNLIRFIPEAIEALSLDNSPTVTSGAAAGLIRHRLRRGGPDLKLTLRGETDRFTSQHESRLDTYSYGYDDLLLLAEGQLGSENLWFFVAGERETFEDPYRKFWNGFRFGDPDTPFVDFFSGESLQDVLGSNETVVPPGNIPNADLRRYNVNGIVTANLKPFHLRLFGVVNDEERKQNDTPIRDIFNQERIPERKSNSSLLSLQTDYNGPHGWNAHLQLDGIQSSSERLDPIFGDDLVRAARDSLFADPRFARIHLFSFSRPGAVLSDFAKLEETGWSLSGYAQKRIGAHRITAGGGWQRRTVRQFSVDDFRGYMQALEDIGIPAQGQRLSDEALLQIRRWGRVNTLGYDVFGNKVEGTDAVNDGPRQPAQWSFYLEDAYRAGDLLLNVGLRYDAFSSDARVFADPKDPVLSLDPFNIPVSEMEKAADHDFISPRVHATWVTGPRLALHFNFGRYVQQPQLRDIYASRAEWGLKLGSGIFNNDPRALDIEPVRSTQTELGISYRVPQTLNLRTTVFFKDIDGQFESGNVRTDPGAIVGSYLILDDTGESTAKGIEVGLDYQDQGFTARLNYTLSEVTGYNSYPISNLVQAELDPDELGIRDEPPKPLDFNQTHRGNVLLKYRTDAEAPPWIRRTGLHLLFRFNSGHNFTLWQGGFG
ncbi:TonB-dependent receptor [candidate division KSB1 bacterium]|nr:TonB-dependent receptor [candidate division KSB1 bacterium]NIR68753.1 TonB-dependent receptor [candidate division KSB1 bacterium]NIS25569.1 TonB-dependent receptor [candidate division KSB1 bacterium]NIT72463.1 TonB-dependent receptor [candidate division KSB1 bacterium]NIU26247.1 TonB-dependent receptor [candidate division KSB1 bacterium]